MGYTYNGEKVIENEKTGRFETEYGKDTPYYRENGNVYRQDGEDRSRTDKMQETGPDGKLRDKF